jgi:X-X-X-Leu-X-X-Gly heptad repeat protein
VLAGTGELVTGAGVVLAGVVLAAGELVTGAGVLAAGAGELAGAGCVRDGCAAGLPVAARGAELAAAAR